MLRIFEDGQEILLPETDEEREAEIFRRIDEVKEKKLTALDLGGLGLTEISDAVVERVAEVSWVTELYLGPHRVAREKPQYPYNYIDKKICNAVREIPTNLFNALPHMKSLDLKNNSIGDLGAKVIAESISCLTTLYLNGNNIGDEGAKTIASSLTNLTNLNMGRNRIGGNGAKAIAASLKNLTTLNLNNNSIGNEGAKAIATSLTQLTGLYLYNNSIGIESAKAIADSLEQLTSLHLGDNDIGVEGAKAIAASLKKLSSLNLSDNSIGDEGAKAIATSLTQLTTLNMSNNSIGDEGVKTIAASLTQLTTLNIGDNSFGVDSVKTIATSLTQLTSLNLSSNGIGDEGAKAIASSLTQLTSLNLSGNGIGTEGARAIADSLAKLIALDLNHNSIGNEGAKAIATSLTQLSNLNLRDNSIGDEGAKAIATSLTKLSILNLRDNNIGYEGAKGISTSLTKLTTLNLGDNSIRDEGAKAIATSLTQLSGLYLRGSGIGDEGAKAIAVSLTQLIGLDLWRNSIGDEGAKAIATSLTQLSSLNLNNNYIRDEGAKAIAASLTQLTDLGLRGNRLGDEGIKAIAASLTQLTDLDLRGNGIGDEGAKAIAASLTQLTNLDLQGNNITIIPKEALNSTDAKRIFLAIEDRLTEKNFPLNEAKLIVVGEGAVGKTSLIRYMVNGEPRRESEEQTIGADIQEEIETQEWFVTEETEKNDIKLNIWDFGGQEIMHGTHQYFLTERSLYLLVLDGRKKDDNTVYKWLKLIRNRGKDSPVLIVINKAVNEHEKQKVDLDRKDLLKKFPNIVEFLETSCNDNEAAKNSIDDLKKTIVLTLQNNQHLKHIFDRLPEAHLQIKDDLSTEAEDKKVLKKDRFKELCVTRGINDETRQAYLLQLFHDLGIVIAHGIDPDAPYVVKDINLLDPNWLVTAIYEILMQTNRSSNCGEFKQTDLCNWLDSGEYPEEWHEFIIAMMKHESISLCFELADRNTFLIPQALPKSAPDIENWNSCLCFRYNYDLLTTNLLPHFMVTANAFHDPDAPRWRSGVLLNVSGCRVLVAADKISKKVDIEIDGGGNPNQSRGALETIRNLFFMVHRHNPEVKATAIVPIPDNPDKEVDYEELLEFEKDEGFGPNHRIQKKQDGGYWTVSELLDGVGRRNMTEDDYKYQITNNYFSPGSNIQLNDISGHNAQIRQIKQVDNEKRPASQKKSKLSSLLGLEGQSHDGE